MATEVKNTRAWFAPFMGQSLFADVCVFLVDETTLFRRNCMITKLLTVYARRSGLQYLLAALKPVIGKIPGFNIEDYELVGCLILCSTTCPDLYYSG